MPEAIDLLTGETVEVPESKPYMDMMIWMNTEGGRKCPQCGRYAKASELGNLGGVGNGMALEIFGHLPGFGCNRAKGEADA